MALTSLLDELADERRTAFVLTQLFGLTYEEAAQVCRGVARAREDLVTLVRDAEAEGHEGRSTG